jgi:hypothetical protein
MRRRLVLIDLENLVGQSPRCASACEYRHAFHALVASLNLTDEDLIVVGVNPNLAFVAGDIAPGARIVTRGGPDGAEDRLIEELRNPAFLAQRFGRVVIASGDHGFLDSVLLLNHHDVDTTVAALPDQLATSLRLAARHIVWLSPPREPLEAA